MSEEVTQIKERLQRYSAMQRDIDNQIERLERLQAALGDPDERAVIRMRYFDREGWGEIAEVLFGGRGIYQGLLRRTYKLHGNALYNLTLLVK